MGAGGNGSDQWEWKGNGNKTRLNLGSGMGMGMNHWEWEGIGLKKTFPLISSQGQGHRSKKSCVCLLFAIGLPSIERQSCDKYRPSVFQSRFNLMNINENLWDCLCENEYSWIIWT